MSHLTFRSTIALSFCVPLLFISPATALPSLLSRPWNTTSALSARGAIVPVPPETVARVMEYVHFSRTGYCKPENIETWNCGVVVLDPCEKTGPGVIPLALGGDGNGKPDWHVVYSSKMSSVVVVHQGTDRRHFKSVLIDLEIGQGRMNKHLFPNLDSSIKIHKGFRDVHAISAKPILEAVRKALDEGVIVDYSGRREFPRDVVVTGYSLGAATSVLSALHLRVHLDPLIRVVSVSVGTPMVGNRAFARWADQALHPPELNNIRVVNGKDWVPRLPVRVGPAWYQCGVEYHIDAENTWWNCGLVHNYHHDDRCSYGYTLQTMEGSAHHFVENISMNHACVARDEEEPEVEIPRDIPADAPGDDDTDPTSSTDTGDLSEKSD
ncbi:hypothetical protein FRB99_006185 [Tulasnella sp. 403]|nr:hypothetical protein FRB99_006185 [Tulasnella sp. 403]